MARSPSPAGVAHGFLALEPLRLAYFVTAAYEMAATSWASRGTTRSPPFRGPPSQGGRDGHPILSGRDQANPFPPGARGASSRELTAPRHAWTGHDLLLP